jgi:hypothetical protein
MHRPGAEPDAAPATDTDSVPRPGWRHGSGARHAPKRREPGTEPARNQGAASTTRGDDGRGATRSGASPHHVTSSGDGRCGAAHHPTMSPRAETSGAARMSAESRGPLKSTKAVCRWAAPRVMWACGQQWGGRWWPQPRVGGEGQTTATANSDSDRQSATANSGGVAVATRRRRRARTPGRGAYPAVPDADTHHLENRESKSHN